MMPSAARVCSGMRATTRFSGWVDAEDGCVGARAGRGEDAHRRHPERAVVDGDFGWGSGWCTFGSFVIWVGLAISAQLVLGVSSAQ
jgi:hypothetical protein